MITIRKASLIPSVLIATYLVGYLVSVQRFVGYVGSGPIYDPNWEMVAELQPTYRFINASFWSPIHRIDRALRPTYWTLVIRADVPVSEWVPVVGKIFNTAPRPILNKVFPTIMDVQ